jgi:RNA polymerase sigma factor (sigma-70 family)
MTGNETTDEQLMRDYQRGDRQAFDELFRRYAPRLHAFFCRAFSARSTADDLLQQTFLNVHSSRASFRDGASVRAWLFAIASHVRADALRAKYRRAPREDALDEELVGEDGHRSLELSHEALRVRRALDALPEGQQIVVLLHRYHGLTFREIAEVLSSVEGATVKEVAVRVRASRAYDALRATLDHSSDDSTQSEGP